MDVVLINGITAYLPIFIVSVLGGLSGLIKRREFEKLKFLEVITGNGLLGVICLIFLNDFTDLSQESKYAFICLFSYLGMDEAEKILLKIKGFKKDDKTFN